jgi:hypothetical protein
MYDQDYNLTFHSKVCEIRKACSGRLVANANRTSNNVYILDEVKGEKSCMGQVNEIWLWHRRMGHINFDNLVKLGKTQAVRDMPRIEKPIDVICKSCQHEKQIRVSFKKRSIEHQIHWNLYTQTSADQQEHKL